MNVCLLCICNDLVKIVNLVTVKYNPGDAILCFIGSKFTAFLNHILSSRFHNFNNKIFLNIVRKAVM